MKIKCITIQGLHNVDSKKYEFSNVNYLYGDNGAGKSTVLAGIQLALLGYIPGTPKTNEGILRHSRNNSIYVQLELEDNQDIITITRSWTKAGTKVNSIVSVTPEGTDIDALLGNAVLPVFDFNEFMNLTANKKKEWFMQFLPSAEGSVDWNTELRNACEGIQYDYTEMLQEELESIATIGVNTPSLIDTIISENARLKELQSFIKGSIARLQGTIQSLVHYDDCDDMLDVSCIKGSIAELELSLQNVRAYNAYQSRVAEIKENIAKFDVSADCAENDPQYVEACEAVDALQEKISELSTRVTEINSKKLELTETATKNRLLAAGEPICPFTKSECQTVKPLLSDAKIAYDNAVQEIEKLNAEEGNVRSSIAGHTLEIASHQKTINTIVYQHTMRQNYVDELNALPKVSLTECYKESELLEQIDCLRDNLTKAEANKQYQELAEKVAREKFELENKLEVVKRWISLTAANGLQTQIMDAPFEKLKDEINKYLHVVMDPNVSCEFVLSDKANSFAFGIIRNDEYISFESLSSGEKCLFTFALLMCLIIHSDSKIKLLLADDILDHLDDKKALKLFTALSKFSIMQGIIAGVKECKLPDQKMVIEIKR